MTKAKKCQDFQPYEYLIINSKNRIYSCRIFDPSLSYNNRYISFKLAVFEGYELYIVDTKSDYRFSFSFSNILWSFSPFNFYLIHEWEYFEKDNLYLLEALHPSKKDEIGMSIIKSLYIEEDSEIAMKNKDSEFSKNYDIEFEDFNFNNNIINRDKVKISFIASIFSNSQPDIQEKISFSLFTRYQNYQGKLL